MPLLRAACSPIHWLSWHGSSMSPCGRLDAGPEAEGRKSRQQAEQGPKGSQGTAGRGMMWAAEPHAPWLPPTHPLAGEAQQLWRI